ncbi:MCP four helix bundle domain-containing protein, partial [Chryseobacterium sp. SIMBA_028]
ESNAQGKQAQRTQHDEALASFNATMAEYGKLVSSAEEQQIFDDIRKAWAAFLAADRNLLELSESGDPGFAAARQLATGESARLFTGALQLIERDVELNRTGAATASAEAAVNYRTTILLTAILCGAAVL